MFGSNSGTYECCGSEAIRFSVKHETNGCCSKSHIPQSLKESSLEAKFLLKHKECLAEPSGTPTQQGTQIEESKVDNVELNSNDPTSASQSNLVSQKSLRK